MGLTRGTTGAFEWLRKALENQEAIENKLGCGGSYLYLSRAAHRAGAADKAVALAARSIQIYEDIGYRFGLTLDYGLLHHAFAAQGDEAANKAATVLAWSYATEIGDSTGAKLEPLVREVYPSDERPTPEDLVELERVVQQAIETCKERLAAAGLDPLTPLETAADGSAAQN